MLGLITWSEIWNVINLSKDHGSDWFMEGPTRRFIETYKERPGFFTPYQDKNKFAGGLLATVVYPAVLSVFASLSATCAVLGATLGIGCLLVAAGAALFGSGELCDESIENASTIIYITGLALVITAVSSFLAVINLFHAPLSFLTRSGASLVSLMSDYIAQTKQKDLEKTGHEQNPLIIM